MAVCIGAMHRSGTSMVARLLHLCSLYVGQEYDLMHLTQVNSHGFCAKPRFVEINEESLGDESGGGWDCPPLRSEGWKEGKEILHLRTKAKAILQKFLGHEPWGWKDSRNSLTLPFRMMLISEIRFVIRVRNSLESVRSRRCTF